MPGYASIPPPYIPKEIEEKYQALQLTNALVDYLNDTLRLQRKYDDKIPQETLQKMYEAVAKLAGVPDYYFARSQTASEALVEVLTQEQDQRRQNLIKEYEVFLERIVKLTTKYVAKGHVPPAVEQEIQDLVNEAAKTKQQLMEMDTSSPRKEHENVTPEGVIDLDEVSGMY